MPRAINRGPYLFWMCPQCDQIHHEHEIPKKLDDFEFNCFWCDWKGDYQAIRRGDIDGTFSTLTPIGATSIGVRGEAGATKITCEQQDTS